MGCGKKGYYIKDYRSKDVYIVKGTNMLKDNNRVKSIRECLIKHFAFCYNNAYRIYKDAKYSISY